MLGRLFVYGTLRPGGSRWALLRNRCRSAGPARAEGTLYVTPYGFPAARFDRPGTIRGDLLDLEPDGLEETLALIDRVEGVDRGLFERLVVEVVAAGERLEAWSYQYRGGLDEGTRIPGGDWTEAPGA